MIKTLQRIISEEKERFSVPKRVQQTVPIKKIYHDGIFLTGKKYSKTYRFSDINYKVAGGEDKQEMFIGYCELLNSLDTSADTKITISNRTINKKDFEKNILLSAHNDGLDKYRIEYNQMLTDAAMEGNGIMQEKYITVSVTKSNIDEARIFFNRVSGELTNRFASLSSKCSAITLNERLRILHDFYRSGEEEYYRFDINETMKKGHDFKDYICPDSIEIQRDYFRLGNKFGRAIFLKEYPTFLKDSMFTELTELNKNLMISVTLNPIPMDEAIREVESRLLGIETNITNWQRRQNNNNNFSATIPYDMDSQRKEAKEFLDDLVSRDQRMMMAVVSLVHLSDSKEELDTDTETIISTARKYLCQLGTLTFQQLEGLNTTLPIGVRKINTFRTLTTESAAAVSMPFTAQQIYHRNGTYCGINAITKDLILVDRAELQNGNCFILGVPGSGKSFKGKEEIVSAILSGNAEVIVVDPEREYSRLVKSLGGEVVYVSSTSKTHINAMDIHKYYGDGSNPVTSKSEFLLSLVEQVYGKPLTAIEKSLIDRVCAKVYKPYIKSGYKGEVPTLKDLYDELMRQSETEAKDIALSIELFVYGSLNTFAKPTNVNTSNRLICYDILDLGKDLLPVGMLVVLDSILNRITKNRSEGRNTYIFIDEIYLLFQHEYSANFLSTLWKRVRKYGAYATGITQNVDDLLQSHTARTMIANSEYVVMLNQAATDREKLAKLMNISELQLSYITNADAGCGLIKVGSSLVPFVDKFPHNELYLLMSTKFGEV